MYQHYNAVTAQNMKHAPNFTAPNSANTGRTEPHSYFHTEEWNSIFGTYNAFVPTTCCDVAADSIPVLARPLVLPHLLDQLEVAVTPLIAEVLHSESVVIIIVTLWFATYGLSA